MLKGYFTGKKRQFCHHFPTGMVFKTLDDFLLGDTKENVYNQMIINSYYNKLLLQGTTINIRILKHNCNNNSYYSY